MERGFQGAQDEGEGEVIGDEPYKNRGKGRGFEESRVNPRGGVDGFNCIHCHSMQHYDYSSFFNLLCHLINVIVMTIIPITQGKWGEIWPRGQREVKGGGVGNRVKGRGLGSHVMRHVDEMSCSLLLFFLLFLLI